MPLADTGGAARTRPKWAVLFALPADAVRQSRNID